MKLSFLHGVTLGQWMRLLRDERFAVSPRSLHHAALITLMATQNSIMARGDRRLDLSEATPEPPIFILGHWRSGTTHLHYLLNVDERFSAPTTYDCAWPHSFLTRGESHRASIERFSPKSRPQDSVEFGLHTPQEDELALTVLSLKSPYIAWAFPDSRERYLRYLTFDGEPEAAGEFMDAMELFLRKLTWRERRPILLKSPGHTARIAMILERYPDARFIHIHRNPYEVYASSCHLYESWRTRFAFLQRPRYDELSEQVLGLYERLYRSFEAQRHLIPEGQLHTLSFDELRESPIESLELAYSRLGLGNPPLDALGSYLRGLSDYRQNSYQPLDDATAGDVAARWGFAFELFGYKT